MTAEKIILKYQEKGVKLFLNEDKLQFSGPKGIIDDDARKELQAYKDDIITYLKSHKGQVVCNKTQRFLPFEMTDIQVAYVIGRNRTYQYGGIGCKIYAEYEFPKLDLEKLERAWENVVKNNDMLHAVIKNNKEQQILQDYEVPAIEKWKIEDISPDERKNKLNEIRDRLVMKQYKVGEWPLFDLEISELEDVTILHISLDMLIADFLSINIIVDELEDNYFGDKKKTFTKELSFRDVIVYEHNRQKHPQYSETMKKDKQYWEERISTMPEAPDLPVKEDLKDTSIRQLNTYIEKERYLELQKLADDNNITLSGLILACYAEVLAYWSNSKRFSINVTMANREQVHPDIYSIIGDFTKINILEICQDYNLSFIQRVQFIQKQLWNDMEHMSYSGIEVLREMTRLKKKEVIIPYVFTSTLSMVSRKESTNHKGNLIYKISQTPQVLIDCQVMEYKEGILVNWDVREKAFPKKMIEMAFRTFSEMLIYTDTQNMLADKNVIKLPSDMKEIRKKKEVNYPYIPQLLHEGFCESVKKYPSKIALCSNGKEYTYKELGEYATSVKKELLRKNIKTADIVAIELKKGIWQIASVLGVLLAGGTYLPVDIGQPRNRKNKIELDAQAKFIITSNKNIDLLDCAEKIYVEDMVVADALEVEVLNTNTNQAAYIIYTSGTTGNPKGVVISHASAMNTINDVIRRYNITKNDSVLGISNLAFDLSVFDIFGIFAVGGKLVLPTDEKNVSEWGTLLLENQITIWNSVPAQMQMLLSYLEAEKKRKVEKLRLIMLSGDWIPVQLPKRMKQIFGNSRMISLGGATEASIWSIAYEINPDYVYEKSIPYGIPLSNQKFYILDDEMRECPDWVKGRIYISGKGLALGYFKDDSLTCRKFVFHKELEERLYDTGDMGRYRTDGVIEFLGREDYQVKIRGHRVELNEVESVINQCEDVEGSIVVTATENDDIIGAFVQPKIEKSVVDNTAEINDIKNKNKSFNQDSNLFEANVLDFADWLHASNETAIYDMLATFYKVEIFTDRNTWYPIKEIFNSLKVHEYYEPLIRRWLKALETEGYVVKNDKNQYRIKKEITRDLAEHSWEQWLKVDSKVHYNDLMMNFFGETRTNLLPLLRGKLDPIDLFFPKGSFKVALAAYKDNIVSKCTNRVVVEDMLVLVKHFTKKYPQKQFRILEIGAGVGGVSIDLIEALKIYNVEYLFTDISRSFLNEAQERFKKYPWVKFGLYDINIDYWKQDIPTSYFDVILCNNVLHNANNEVKVLGQFKEIAAPNGNLIIIDATGNNYALMTSIEFLNGLNGVEDFRAENEQIFLQQDQWNKLFKKSDIELLAAFPEEDSTLKVIGQTVFVCKFNSKRRRIDPSEIKNYMANNLPEYMLPSHIEVLKEFPLTANGKIDRNILRNHLDGTLTQTTEQGEAPSTDLEKAIAQIWCDALKKEKIWKNENFYEIGGDSLLVAQVVAKMKEKIEEAKAWDWDKLMIALIESPTIEGISKKLMEGLPSEETKEKQESLIILKQGNNNKALVLIHDGTGTISPYNQVIPFLHSTEGSLLALQCNDMEEYLSVKPEKLIQFLGEKYAKILIDTEKEVYDLVGYCMGGLIALETAKILTEAGKTVHSLISVDTTPSRRMVNNELLMERAFGMIIGADTYKVGHTVEDELLKRAIKELGEKYGDNVSNEELVSLEGEFLPVSQCYGKLIKKTHAERLLELYNTLPATKGETSGYSKERLDTLYKVFCHSFSAVIMYDAGIYVGNALVLSCRNKNSSFLPVEPTDNERFWKEATVGNITSELIEGEHLTCMTGSYADKVAERILKEERL